MKYGFLAYIDRFPKKPKYHMLSVSCWCHGWKSRCV